mmetsp:Transcript_38859/g.91464  ORF Transcript_38859/g.91464 Transcript_38859/m.91464 type:complete len:293 (-) Transcript_38859:49-927(-)
MGQFAVGHAQRSEVASTARSRLRARTFSTSSSGKIRLRSFSGKLWRHSGQVMCGSPTSSLACACLSMHSEQYQPCLQPSCTAWLLAFSLQQMAHVTRRTFQEMAFGPGLAKRAAEESPASQGDLPDGWATLPPMLSRSPPPCWGVAGGRRCRTSLVSPPPMSSPSAVRLRDAGSTWMQPCFVCNSSASSCHLAPASCHQRTASWQGRITSACAAAAAAGAVLDASFSTGSFFSVTSKADEGARYREGSPFFTSRLFGTSPSAAIADFDMVALLPKDLPDGQPLFSGKLYGST